MKILVACEESQAVTIAFREKGHEAYSCDLLDCSGCHPEWHIKGDVLEQFKKDWDMMIAFPPCTHLSSSGARWFPQKIADGRQQEGIDFFIKLAFAKIDKICLENPVGIMSTYLRKPDQYIQPWEYGHPETKKTGLWLKGLHPLIPTNIVEPDFMKKADGSYYLDKKGKKYSRVHFMSRNIKNRGMLRSKTFPGIAAAMADQWG